MKHPSPRGGTGRRSRLKTDSEPSVLLTSIIRAWCRSFRPALVERASGLGWPPSRVLVIDEDMGHSAAGGQERPGFIRLVSEVGLGHVGVVLGIEMSRLARCGRDWHQLLELCALSGTLLADPDGVYDPAEHNDRLLLGLKGTISEALCRRRHKASYPEARIMPTSGGTLLAVPGRVLVRSA